MPGSNNRGTSQGRGVPANESHHINKLRDRTMYQVTVLTGTRPAYRSGASASASATVPAKYAQSFVIITDCVD